MSPEEEPVDPKEIVNHVTGKGPVTAGNEAKIYLESKFIPQIFESLLASLMLDQPKDPVLHLDLRLKEIQETGVENIDWKTFLGQHRSRVVEQSDKQFDSRLFLTDS